MSDFKKTYTLIQHTPILHFQHLQGDVVLRTTEVKPKLDKFLIKQLGGWDKIKSEHYDWCHTKEDHHSLDYKMKIWVTPKSNQHKVENYIFTSYLKDDDSNEIRRQSKTPISNSPFFADAENIKNRKFDDCKVGLYYAQDKFDIQLSIFTLHEDLLSIIHEKISFFFVSHNFGTRQSKGFGSFTIKDQNMLPQSKYFFSVNPTSQSNEIKFKSLFTDIDLFWKALRSGLNDNFKKTINKGKSDEKEIRNNGIYFKSIMFRYAKNVRLIQWDKKTIKEHFFYDKLLEQRNDNTIKDKEVLTYSNDKKRLMRDMLGLSTEQKWLHKDYNNASIKKTHEGNLITRFKSPIIFKPIYDGMKWNIYLVVLGIPVTLAGQNFEVKALGNPLNIQFPTKEEATITDFLNYTFGNYKGNGFFEKDELNDQKYNKPNDVKFKRLKEILTEIRTNLNSQN